jgi:putative transposase
LLATQDPERARQAAEVGSAQRASGSTRDLAVGKPRGGRSCNDPFAEKYAPKYDKAVDCLLKDRGALLTFFDFPAEHWTHLRTANPIESAFATVRHRTVRMKGALSQETTRLMVFKLIIAAAKTWRRLQGQNQLPKVDRGVKFRAGIEVANQEMSAA